MGLRIKGLEKLRQELERKININNSTFRLKIGKMARDLIYKRVKSGYGTSSTDPITAVRTRLKPLSQSYIDQRKKNKKTFGEFGSVKRSNLTMTGQMLDAIRYEANSRSIRVYVDDSQRDDGMTNAEVARYVQEARPFFVLTRDELTVLIREIERELKKLSRR